jgi:hypoxanthine phosphoribosyltransferase
VTGQSTEQADGDLWRKHVLYLLSWTEFDAAIRSIAAQVRASGIEVDCVLGISRGGLPPAVALSNVLGVPDLHVVAVGRNVGAGQYLEKQPPVVLWQGNLAGVRDRRVLVVDDVAGSGETLRFVHEQATQAGAAEVHTATVVRMGRGSAEADFVAVELDDWVVFPWEDTKIPDGARTRQALVPAPEQEAEH